MVSLFVCLYHNRKRGHKVTASSVPIVASHSNERLQMPYCPNCGVGNEEPLYTWNPIEGRCPKCEGKMKEEEILHTY